MDEPIMSFVVGIADGEDVIEVIGRLMKAGCERATPATAIRAAFVIGKESVIRSVPGVDIVEPDIVHSIL